MNLRTITKNHEADPEIGFLTKSISKPNGRATAMPTAWELSCISSFTGQSSFSGNVFELPKNRLNAVGTVFINIRDYNQQN